MCETLGLFKGAKVTVVNIRKQLHVHKHILVNFTRLYILLATIVYNFVVGSLCESSIMLKKCKMSHIHIQMGVLPYYMYIDYITL